MKGTLLTATGDPIVGATCGFRSAGNKAVTDAKGMWSMTGPVGVLRPTGYAVSMSALGRQLVMTLDRAGRVSLDLFGLDGRNRSAVADRDLPAGISRIDFASKDGARGLYLLRVRVRVCQSIWKTAAEVPAKVRFTSYKGNINSQVTTPVASTGGNSLNFNVGYIAGLKGRGNAAALYEVEGVLVHEATHSYQPYYSTAGADGFGESMPDAVRALTGYFKWPTGTKCSGSFTEAYQTGGKYWYFIEMKHPGFINGVYKLTAGDISARVQQVTGESLAAMVAECQTKGMP